MATATNALHTEIPVRMGHYCASALQEKPTDTKLVSGPVIASITSAQQFEHALLSPTRTLFLHTGDPLLLPSMLGRAAKAEKHCILNLDFVEGFARDRSAVGFLATLGLRSISSTRIDVLKAARMHNMYTIQRTFAIDTASIAAARKSLEQFRPDALEILPAPAAPRVRDLLLESHPGLTVFAGGLIENVREIETLLLAGIDAVTTSNSKLWII